MIRRGLKISDYSNFNWKEIHKNDIVFMVDF